MDKYLAIREKIDEAIEKNLKEIAELSDYIADHPEVSGEEYETSKKLVETLRAKGFETEYPFAGLETSFRAIYGPNDHKYKVAVLTEYDALPGIGHACGHNLSGVYGFNCLLSEFFSVHKRSPSFRWAECLR